MIIQLEDGRKLEVQDGASPQQIDEVISQVSAPAQNTSPEVAPYRAPVSSAESFARGAMQGGSLGYGDEAMGAIGTLYAKVMAPELFKDRPMSSMYTEARDSARQDNAAAREAHPWWYTGGQVTGGVATGMKIPMPVSTAGKYTAGAAIGGAAGYGSSDAKTVEGKTLDTGLGVLGGMAGTYAGDKIGRGLSAAANSKTVQSAKNTAKDLLAKFYTPGTTSVDPLNVYHGSNQAIDPQNLKPGLAGRVFLTTNKSTANDYVRGGPEGLNAYKLNIRPQELLDTNSPSFLDFTKKLAAKNNITDPVEDIAHALHDDPEIHGINPNLINDFLRTNGFKGLRSGEDLSLLPEYSKQYLASTAMPKVDPTITEAMRNGATPEQAAILERAKKFNVPLSRGDVTRTAEQQGLEDLALRGALGPEANATASSFRSNQEQSLRQGAKDTITNISRHQYMDNINEMGDSVGSRLKLLEATDDGNVTRGYEAVKAAGNAKINVPFINKHLQGAWDELKEYPLDTMPGTRSVMDRAAKVFPQTQGGRFQAPADIAKIDNFRKFMNRSSSSVQLGNQTDKAGIQIIKAKLDGAIDDAVERNLVYGNPEAIGKLKAARDTAREYFQRWRADDALQKIVENDYTPEQVVNLVRGYGQTGGNKQAAALVSKLSNVLGKDSPEFAMMKQAQLRQIFGNNLDSLMTGDISKGFNAEEVRKNLTSLINNNRSLANAYFSPAEQKTLKDFLDVSYRATNRVPGAVNYSNTTPALIRWGRQFANNFGALGRLAGTPFELAAQGMGGIKAGAEGAKAIESFGPQFRNPNNPLATALKNKLSGAGAATGANLGGQKSSTKEPLRVTVHPLQKYYK